MLSLNHGVYIIEKGYKKTVCPDGKYFHQNKLFFIFTLIIFSEHSYFLRKSQITPERKQRKKIFFNSICTPPEHQNSPQSLYLWAFSQFSPLLKLANKISPLYIFVYKLWFYLVLYVFHCLKSTNCTERCYQFVIMIMLSIKNSCNILIPIDDTIDIYILVAYLVDNHIIFPYRIFIVRPKADSF